MRMRVEFENDYFTTIFLSLINNFATSIKDKFTQLFVKKIEVYRGNIASVLIY